MINATGAAVWESFKHPTDTILPGQVLQVGAALITNSSSTDPSLPFYQLVVEHVGLALYAYSSFTDSIPQQKQPYYVSSLNAKQDVEGVTTTCLHPAMVTFDGTQGLVVSYDIDISLSLKFCFVQRYVRKDHLCFVKQRAKYSPTVYKVGYGWKPSLVRIYCQLDGLAGCG